MAFFFQSSFYCPVVGLTKVHLCKRGQTQIVTTEFPLPFGGPTVQLSLHLVDAKAVFGSPILQVAS